MKRGRRPHPGLLTPREHEVLELLRMDLTNQEIAGRLQITKAGAAYHVSEILSKLQVSSRREAARWRPDEARGQLGLFAAPIGFLKKRELESVMNVSRAVILVGGVGLLALLALGVALMQSRSENTRSLSLDCVTGEAARNPVADDGSSLPRGDMFETVTEAEAFICQDVPQAQDVGNWFVLYAVAFRSQPLDQYQDSSDASLSRRVQIRYDNPGLQSTLTLTALPAPSPVECHQGEGRESMVTLQGVDATLWERLNAGYTGAILCWQTGAQWHEGHLVVHDQSVEIEEVLPEVLTLIESVR